MDSIIFRGIALVAWTFLIIILYLFLSTPFVMTVNDLNNSTTGMSTNTQNVMRFHQGYVKNIFNLAFALAIFIPIIIFMVWVFRREPDWRYRRW